MGLVDSKSLTVLSNVQNLALVLDMRHLLLGAVGSGFLKEIDWAMSRKMVAWSESAPRIKLMMPVWQIRGTNLFCCINKF